VKKRKTESAPAKQPASKSKAKTAIGKKALAEAKEAGEDAAVTSADEAALEDEGESEADLSEEEEAASKKCVLGPATLRS
jgi:hypothetical protein